MPHAYDDTDEDWRDNDSDDGYISCPHCGQTMLEDAEYCPSCDRWMTSEDLPVKRHPWWIVAVVIVLIVVMIVSVLAQ